MPSLLQPAQRRRGFGPFAQERLDNPAALTLESKIAREPRPGPSRFERRPGQVEETTEPTVQFGVGPSFEPGRLAAIATEQQGLRLGRGREAREGAGRRQPLGLAREPRRQPEPGAAHRRADVPAGAGERAEAQRVRTIGLGISGEAVDGGTEDKIGLGRERFLEGDGVPATLRGSATSASSRSISRAMAPVALSTRGSSGPMAQGRPRPAHNVNHVISACTPASAMARRSPNGSARLPRAMAPVQSAGAAAATWASRSGRQTATWQAASIGTAQASPWAR